MAANLPQTLAGVTRLYDRLRRDGVIRDGVTHARGDWVQFRVRREVLCGRVLGELKRPDDGGQVRIAVAATIGDFWPTAFNVRPCSKVADGRCACATDAPAAAAQAQRRRFPSPLGNTGVAA